LLVGANISAAAAAPIDKLHALLAALHGAITFERGATNAATTAEQAFALKRGVAQDYAHMFIACARHLDCPARYVGGYVLRDAEEKRATAGHAWAEAHVPGLGWVSFDPSTGACPTDAEDYGVRVDCVDISLLIQRLLRDRLAAPAQNV